MYFGPGEKLFIAFGFDFFKVSTTQWFADLDEFPNENAGIVGL